MGAHESKGERAENGGAEISTAPTSKRSLLKSAKASRDESHAASVATPPPPLRKDSAQPWLTETQRELLLSNWSRSENRGYQNAGQRIFAKIFENSEEVRSLFQSVIEKNDAQQLLDGSNKPPPNPSPSDGGGGGGVGGGRRSGGSGRAGMQNDEFTKAFYKHIRVFMNMLELAVSKCDNLDELGSLCLELGRRHQSIASGKGFKPEYWKIFENAVLECAIEWDDDHDATEKKIVQEAWALVVDFIMLKMRQGFSESKT